MNAPDTNIKRRDFSNVSHEEAVERARALIPFLRKHASGNDKATKLVPEVVEALHESGMFRFLSPKAWGGMEIGRAHV